jgi:CRP-like cAMP-binding protein
VAAENVAAPWPVRDDPVTDSTQSALRVTVLVVAGVEDIASVPLFKSLDDDQLSELATWFHAQNAGEGVRLVGEGAPGYTFFILMEGSAAVTSDGESLATLGPGDFFGEIAILGDGRRTATVTSTTPVRLLVMFGTEFRRLEAAHPEIAARLTEAMQARLGGHIPEPA